MKEVIEMTEMGRELLSATTAKELGILLKTVLMKELRELIDLREMTEVLAKGLDVSNVRNLDIWPRTAIVEKKMARDKEDL